jgi:integrase
MVVLRKILKYGLSNDLIDKLPVFPKITGKLKTTQKRDYLTDEEYDLLVRTSEQLSKDKEVVRGVTITLEMKYLIQFMVNSFIRPSDLRVIKHRHIKMRKEGKETWIELNHPGTKTNSHPVQCMTFSVGVYNKLNQLRLQTQESIKPDDFVFFPEYKNRDTMMSVVGRLFRKIVEKTGIQEQTDKNLTLYSLRHTSIMMRLIKGNVNTLHLSRNCRTSQQMIDSFYGQHLTTDDVRVHLQRFESVEKKKEEQLKKRLERERLKKQQEKKKTVPVKKTKGISQVK